MPLQPGRYLTHGGRRVTIEGLARVDKIDGQTILWSIQGDHYAEDGRRVGHIVKRRPGQPFTSRAILLPADHYQSIDPSTYQPKET